MRSQVLCWSLGLITVSWVSGCGLYGGHCEHCGAPVAQPAAGFLPKQVRARPRILGEPPVIMVHENNEPPRIASAKRPGHGSDGSKPMIVTREPELPVILPDVESPPLPVSEKAIEISPFKPAYAPPLPNTDVTLRRLEGGESASPIQPRQEPIQFKEGPITLKTVHIQYGHTENFETVTGQVQAFRKSFRLRYAAISQEDPYGGYVLLDGGNELNRLRDGQHVRLRGVLIPPSDTASPARYRVQTVEVLD